MNAIALLYVEDLFTLNASIVETKCVLIEKEFFKNLIILYIYLREILLRLRVSF